MKSPAVVLLLVLLLTACTQAPPQATSEQAVPSTLAEIDCEVKDAGTNYYCMDELRKGQTPITAWKGKICESATEQIIVEDLKCLNNRCVKTSTVIKACKDYGTEWQCRYDGQSEAEGKTICTNPTTQERTPFY